MELDVLDIQTTIQPLLFIIGLDAEYLISHAGVVQVFRHHIHRQPVSFNHVPGIGKHEVAVRLQMDYAVILQELAVALHEISGSKPFGRLLAQFDPEPDQPIGQSGGERILDRLFTPTTESAGDFRKEAGFPLR